MLRTSAFALAIALGVFAVLVGSTTARAEERDPITTGSIALARVPGGLHAKGELGFRSSPHFSPFLEEGLVKPVPPARYGDGSAPVPAYLRDLYGWAVLP